ncbi:glycoside hydrolase family 92 protein [Maribacter sp. ANRC-HE7]|uniref:Glycoside hydrolase family 92 protein n=1 Tax=Maribacter aquimaris TaxID=2737171 RepID=A0ABR7V2K9_9FLAO|nr:GH92 family glycosyl hydrolase [Maribacter aquimaris]MBD0779048.1 glycoside hydrolase family 92 protein [Maribacter aquimaris]
MNPYFFIAIFLLVFSSCKEGIKPLPEENLTQYVNPFIGTDGPGNTYPGATMPYGMVQLSPDIGIPGWDRIAGYYYQDTIISGFSHTHLTGTGAGDLYDILVMPTNSKSNKRIKENGYRPYSTFSHDKEKASPGYYSVDLLDFDIKAEMTATKRVGIHRYTFPEDDSTKIHIDLGYALNWDKPTDTYLEVVNDTFIRGYRMSTGWAKDQRLYFAMHFSRPFKSFVVYKDGEVVDAPVQGVNTKIELNYSMLKGERLIIKTGLSTAGVEGSETAIAEETHGFGFERYKKKAQEVWEKELSKIRVKSNDKDKKRIFYTMMYQSMLAPTLLSDLDGKYKGANDTIGVAKGFDRYDTFSLWDTFRAAHPLYTIIQQDKVPDMVRSMLAHYQETGVLPVWSMQGNETNMMIGYHAVPVIVDAYFKGFSFDKELAYKACKESAMVNGRQIDVYREKGFIPVDDAHENWSVSKTMEYAYDDWCIAMFAKDLGHEKDYKEFLRRSESWKNLYNEKTSWLQPKSGSGNFITPFVPKEYSPYFCESNAWQYYWFVPQDIDGLIAKTGGKERFNQKLDSMFTYFPEPGDKLPIFSTGMIGQYAHGNEPSHHVAYLYNYLDQPSKTQALVRQILEEQYANAPNGHCGNEDCGQMSSWYIFGALGFYPVNPAQGVYDFGVPLFEEAEVSVEKGKKLRIIQKNFSKENKFVEYVTLNGVTLDRNFITHKEVTAGGELVYVMTDDPKKVDGKKLNSPEVNKIYR